MPTKDLSADYAATQGRVAAVSARIATLRAASAGPAAEYDALARRIANGEDVPESEWADPERQIAAIARELQRHERALQHLAAEAVNLAARAIPFAAAIAAAPEGMQ